MIRVDLHQVRLRDGIDCRRVAVGTVVREVFRPAAVLVSLHDVVPTRLEGTREGQELQPALHLQVGVLHLRFVAVENILHRRDAVVANVSDIIRASVVVERLDRGRPSTVACTRDVQPDWSDGSLSVALGGELRSEGLHFHLMLNAYWEPLEFELPKPSHGGQWRRWIDTSLGTPDDIVPWKAAQTVPEKSYRVEPRTVVMLYIPSQRDAR